MAKPKKQYKEEKPGNFPSEFKKKTITEEAEAILGHCGRMVGGSKSIYNHNHENDLVVFNANICTAEDNKIWHGDLNITEDLEGLKKLARALNKKIYILNEMYGRFENEEKPLLDKAIFAVDPNGEYKLPEDYELINDKIAYVDPVLKELGVTKVISDVEIEKFEINKKSKDSPLHQFYKFIKKTLKLKKNFVVNPDAVLISDDDYTILKYQFYKWALKNNPYYHPVKLRQSVSFEMALGAGPSQDKRLDDGKIYIKEGILQGKAQED